MQNQTPKVAIIILSYNGKNDTLECLESLYKINYDNYIVIVVDNGSTDGSVQAIKGQFKQAVVIENNTNTGFCQGNNIGISHALGLGAEYFFILNNDTVVEASIIQDLKAAVDSGFGNIIVSPLIAYYQNRQQLNFFGSKIDIGNGGYFAQYNPQEILLKKGLLDIDYASWCAVFFKREVIEKVGFLDERFFAYYEDVDWGFRCRKLGLGVKLYPKVLVYHKSSQASGGSNSPNVYFYLLRNRLFFIRKHAGFFRRLQFTICYIRDSFRQYDSLLADKNYEGAKAVMDGFWSAINDCDKNNKIAMPEDSKTRRSIFKIIYLWLMTLKAVFKKS